MFHSAIRLPIAADARLPSRGRHKRRDAAVPFRRPALIAFAERPPRRAHARSSQQRAGNQQTPRLFDTLPMLPALPEASFESPEVLMSG
jgi:hypothetical protein